MKKIPHTDLVCMNEYSEDYGYRIDLAYARPDNILFQEKIYKSNAQLFLHKHLAEAVKIAASYTTKNYNLRMVLYDGLRTVDAQQRMLETQRVKNNPHWLEEPRLLSPPGSGGHPRGMAVDVSLETPDGVLLDMGTPFDYLSENPDHNPAHREFKHSSEITRNRETLDECIMYGAKKANKEIIGLPQEWWDYRLPNDIYAGFAPIRERDLPKDMKLL